MTSDLDLKITQAYQRIIRTEDAIRDQIDRHNTALDQLNDHLARDLEEHDRLLRAKYNVSDDVL